MLLSAHTFLWFYVFLLLPSNLESPEVLQDLCMQDWCLWFPTPVFEKTVEHNIKASRVCDPTIVDVCLISIDNVEPDPGRGHLGQCSNLRRRGWYMCWVGQRRPDIFYLQDDCKPPILCSVFYSNLDWLLTR